MKIPTFKQYAKSRYLESDCPHEASLAEYVRVMGNMLVSQYYTHVIERISAGDIIDYRIARKLFRPGIAEIYYRHNGQFWTGKKLFFEMWG